MKRRFITCKALYEGSVLMNAFIVDECGINPKCWKSEKTDKFMIAETLARRAGSADCPGKDKCRLQMYFHENGRYHADHVVSLGNNRFEHTITYVKIEGLPKLVYTSK